MMSPGLGDRLAYCSRRARHVELSAGASRYEAWALAMTSRHNDWRSAAWAMSAATSELGSGYEPLPSSSSIA